MAEMDRSWLVQRLDRPYGGKSDNPFSFGGGLRNGGLSDDAMDLLRGIFSFDYMGAAEFEFGAVPEALRRIAKHASEYVGWTIQLYLDRVPAPPSWREEARTPAKGEMATIYVLSPGEWEEEVEDRICAWATERRGPKDQPWKYNLKERTNLSGVLRPTKEYPPRTAGWLELDNGFFFFTDEEMWRATAALFGMTIDANEAIGA